MKNEEKHDAYLRKRGRWLADLERAASQTLKGQLLNCVLSTDLCMIVFSDFASSLKHVTAYQKSERERFDARQSEMDRAIAEMDIAYSKLTDEKYKQQLNTYREMLLASKVSTGSQIAQFNVYENEMLQRSVSLIEDALFTGILGNEDAKHSFAALQKLVHLLIDMSPVGGVKGGLETLADVLKQRSSNGKTADEYLDGLETYLFATYQWCILTEAHRIYFEKLNESSVFSVEAGAKSVQSKFDSLANKLKVLHDK